MQVCGHHLRGRLAASGFADEPHAFAVAGGQPGDGFEEVAALHGRLQRNMETGFGAVVARFVPSVNAPLTVA